LEEIASIELLNTHRLAQTYKTDLRDRIHGLLFNEQKSKIAEECVLGMKVIQLRKDVNYEGKNVTTHINIGSNPKDISEEEARRLENLAYNDWLSGFPNSRGTLLIYNFSEKMEYPPKMVLVCVGCEQIKEQLTIKEFHTCDYALLSSEELRTQTKIPLGFRKVKKMGSGT